MPRQTIGSLARSSKRRALVTALLGAIGAGLGGVLGGCSHGALAVPPGAELLARGDGRDDITLAMPHGGIAYVLDRTSNKIAWSGNVRTEDKLEVDGEHGRISLNGHTVAEDVHSEHNYRISLYKPS